MDPSQDNDKDKPESEAAKKDDAQEDRDMQCDACDQVDMSEPSEVHYMFEVRVPPKPLLDVQDPDYQPRVVLWRAPLGANLCPVEAMAARLKYEQDLYERACRKKDRKKARAQRRVRNAGEGLIPCIVYREPWQNAKPQFFFSCFLCDD